MKAAICVGLIWVSLFTMAARGTSGRMPRFQMFGHEYVRIEDWAAARAGQVRWTVPKREVQVTWPGGSLSLSVDSRKAHLKGTHVWLSVPVVYRDGSACLGAMDVTSTLDPILQPSKNSSGRGVRHIVLDPGHGG